LGGIYIDDAVQFDFDNSVLGTTLAPGARLLLVTNQSAFEYRYGSSLPVAGTFSGNLSNSGETITLRAADDAIIRLVGYLDTAGWPAEADGAGSSLVAITPAEFSADRTPTVGVPRSPNLAIRAVRTPFCFPPGWPPMARPIPLPISMATGCQICWNTPLVAVLPAMTKRSACG
jgi:hypothetical protein